MPDPISSASPQSTSYQAPIDGADSQEVRPSEISCTAEVVDVARAGVALAGSVAALVAATPTVLGALPGIAAFIGSSMYMGEAAANLENCRDQAAKAP